MKAEDRGDLVLNGTLLPPAPDLCQACAWKHTPDQPHQAQSMYYQYWFYKQSGGRWPTWVDALAHCAPEVQAAWEAALREKNAWPGPNPPQLDDAKSRNV
jgi:hypothetical protein